MVQCIFDRVIKNDCSPGTVDSTRGRIYSVIKKLKANGSCGPDGFLWLLFKNLSSCLAEPLSLMFSTLCLLGSFHKDWSMSLLNLYITINQGQTLQLENYRFISLTCVSCKLMERTAVSCIFGHLFVDPVWHVIALVNIMRSTLNEHLISCLLLIVY